MEDKLPQVAALFQGFTRTAEVEVGVPQDYLLAARYQVALAEVTWLRLPGLVSVALHFDRLEHEILALLRQSSAEFVEHLVVHGLHVDEREARLVEPVWQADYQLR